MAHTNPIRHLPAAVRKTILCLLFSLCWVSAKAQVSVTATSGTSGPTSYTTLKGAFDAINNGTHQGFVTVTVSANTTETATAALNASGSGSASYTRVLVRPGTSATPTISGALASAPIIKLNGASNVMIDGSAGASITRDLSISNTATTGAQVLVIGSVGTTPVTNDTVKNCNIINGTQTSSALIASDAAAPGTAGYFNNIAIINNSIQKAYIGMYLITAVTGTNGSGTYVAKNNLDATGANALRLVGIYLQGLNGAKVDSNTIGNFETANAEFDRGIWTATGTNNTTITGNTVSNLGYTGASAGYAPIGINISPAVTSANISVTGNTVTNISSTNSGTSTGIYFYSAASSVTLEKNRISNIKNTNTTGYGAAGILLAGTLTASAVNILNNFVWDIAGYGTNAWTSASNGNGIVADGGGGYNIYHNSVWINTNQTATTGTRAAAVLITTNVTTANSINLRNNLLINTQTVGNANSRLALAITANTNVLNTCNYNDYYATSTNLAGQGTNATIWNTIAQIQSNIGLNGNSVSILPTFTSTTDLHLPVASNGSLNNLGVNLAAVPNDIDGDARTSTPDMGADEFGNCQNVTITTQPTTAAFCAGGNTTLTVAGTNGNVFQWQVNTGTGFTNITNGGVYGGATTGTLTITGATAAMNGYIYRAQVSFAAICPQTTSNTVTLIVNPRPSVAVSSSGPTSFCTGGSTVLSIPSASNVTYQWLDGSGPMSGETNASYTASTSGSYYVIATNTVTGCFDTSATTVITVGTGPAAVISPAGPSTICQGKSILLSGGTSSGVSYQWYLNNNPISGATANTYAATAAGSYTVVVSTSPTCATTSAASVVSVFALPTATASTNATAICQGATATLSANTGTSLSYQWLSNNAIITGATASSYNATVAGSYRVIVKHTITTCEDTSTAIAVVVNPLPAASITPTAPPAICERDTTLLTANAGAKLSYQWQLGGNPLSGANALQYKAYQSGNYRVRVTDSNGCQRLSAVVPLLVHPAPVASVTYSSPLEFCEGSAVSLNAIPGATYNYQWRMNGADLPGVTIPAYIATMSGRYSVRVVDNFGCTSLSEDVPVTVFPTPVPVVTRNGSGLSTGSYVSYRWFFNNIAIGVNGDGPTLTPSQNGAYKVTVVDTNGCTGTSDQFFLLNLAAGGPVGLDAQLDVFPNPAHAVINISGKGGLRIQRLTLLDGVGAVVLQQDGTSSNQQISLGDLAAGLYYLRVETDKGLVLKKLQVAR